MSNFHTIVKLSIFNLCSLYLTAAFSYPALAQTSKFNEIARIHEISLTTISDLGAISSLIIGLLIGILSYRQV